jgi:DNA-binding NarL/FixJ family response regulator
MQPQIKTKPFWLEPTTRRDRLLIIQGLSKRDIAERLFICEQTVKDHLHYIFERIKIRRRSELAAKLWDTHQSELQEAN